MTVSTPPAATVPSGDALAGPAWSRTRRGLWELERSRISIVQQPMPPTRLTSCRARNPCAASHLRRGIGQRIRAMVVFVVSVCPLILRKLINGFVGRISPCAIRRAASPSGGWRKGLSALPRGSAQKMFSVHQLIQDRPLELDRSGAAFLQFKCRFPTRWPPRASKCKVNLKQSFSSPRHGPPTRRPTPPPTLSPIVGSLEGSIGGSSGRPTIPSRPA